MCIDEASRSYDYEVYLRSGGNEDESAQYDGLEASADPPAHTKGPRTTGGVFGDRIENTSLRDGLFRFFYIFVLVGRVSLSDAWVTGRGSPYYPVDNSVVAYDGLEASADPPAHTKGPRTTGGVFVLLSFVCFSSDRAPLVTDHHCLAFNISIELRPELPDRNAIIKDILEGKIGMYARFIEFANYRILLSKFLPCILAYYQINLSQLYVIGATKVSHFEIMCRALGRIPTVAVPLLSRIRFRWMRLWICLVKLLNENCTLTRKYPEIFLCLVVLSRLFIETDVLPTLLYDNDEEMGLLDFVNSADPFKVKTGERTLTENEVPLNTETEDRVISPSPQTISLVDHTIQDDLNVNSGKRKKIVAFVFGSPLVKKARDEGIVISDSRPTTIGKSSTAQRRLIRQSEQADAGSRSAVPATEDATSSSVTLTPERVLEDAPYDKVRTRPPSGRFVVLSSGSAYTDIPTSPQVVSPVTLALTGVNVPVTEYVSDGRPSSGSGPEAKALSATPSQDSSANDFYESKTIDFATALNVYVPDWNVTNNARIDNPVICQNLLDHVTPPGYWAALPNHHDVGFLDSFNINSAKHVCIIFELRLRYEHGIMTREKYEKKFTDSAAMVQQRDAEVVDLKVRLEKSVAETVKETELRKRVADLEATVAVKVGEVANLNTENARLLEESFCFRVGSWGVRFAFRKAGCALDARIADVTRDMDNDLYPHMLIVIARGKWVIGHGIRLAVHKCACSAECRSALGKVISMAINKGIQQGLKAGVVHRKAGRTLSQSEDYDPEIKGKYVAVIFEFEGISFPLLDELESLKDSPLTPIMSALTLKDDHGDVDVSPEFLRFQLSLDQVTRIIRFPHWSYLVTESPLASRPLFSRMTICLMHPFWRSLVTFDVFSLWRVSLSDAWVTRRGSPSYPVDNRVDVRYVIARLRSSCSIPLCADYDLCGAAGRMLLVAVCMLYFLRSG
nr:putative transposase (putative), gypsy type [Tanacetum cinerariifolium]